jgi:hypothetical protein
LAQPLIVFKWSGLLSMSHMSPTASKWALSRAAFFFLRLAFFASGLSCLWSATLLSD